MNANAANCPSCKARLTVSPAAPQRIFCPRCGTWLENPGGLPAGAVPWPVVPLEYQARRDVAATQIAAIPLGILLFFGSGLLFCVGGSSPIGMLFVALVIVALSIAAVKIIRRDAVTHGGSSSVGKFIVKVIFGFFLAAIGIFLLILGFCAVILVHH